MPVLLATLLVPALLTWGLSSTLRLSEEDLVIVFVALFLLTFLVSVAGAHLLEHGQRFRRQKLLEDMTTTQKLQWLLSQRMVVAAGLGLVALAAWGTYRFNTSTSAPPTPTLTQAAPAPSAPASAVVPAVAVAAAASPVQPPPSPVRPASAPAATSSTADQLAATVATKTAQELAQAQQAVQTWAAAWAARDVDAYLRAYSPHFANADGLTRAQWETQRRQRITAAQGLSIKVMDLAIEPAGRDKVQAVFIQRYQTAKLNDLSRKTLVLQKYGDDWKIVLEQATALKG